MSIKLIGTTSGVELDTDTTFKALRAQPRPSSNAAYGVVAQTGALTAATVTAGGPLFAFRNIGTGYVILERLLYNAVVTTAFTAAQRLGVDLIKATAWSASDTGGTAITAVTKRITSMGTSIVGTANADVRVATTSILTAGTRTLDANPIAVSQFWTAGVGTVQNDTVLTDSTSSEQHAYWFGTNEGFLVRNLVVFPAAGVLQVTLRLEWREVATYPG